MFRAAYRGVCRRSVVESGVDAPRAGVHRQEQLAGGVARFGAVRPRGRRVRSLPPFVRGADSFARHALHGDLQRFGGLLRAGRRSAARRHAADARLRHLFRVPRRTYRPAVGRGSAGPQLRHDHLLQQRAVALRNRRPRGVHVDRPLPHPFRRAYASVHQCLRRGAHSRKRRPCPGRSLHPHGGRRHGVQRGAALHVAQRAGRPRVVRRVRPAARRPGAVRRGARRGLAQRQFRLRRQAADHPGASAPDGRGTGDLHGLDAVPRQEQGAAAGQRPPRGRRPAEVRVGKRASLNPGHERLLERAGLNAAA